VSGIATVLAEWAVNLEPTDVDLALADRALKDTVAVACAAREHPLRGLFAQLPEAGRQAAFAHVLDFDDLHLPSTTHISAVCVPAALASEGDARAYLAGAGVMARLGKALGWRHYTAGWHATCTTGAPAAAVTAAVARGLDRDATAVAIALAIPGAGGVQRAFGTASKSLQVGFAVEAGLRAAALAQAGASADPAALDQWLGLVGGDPAAEAAKPLERPAVPGGLAMKLYPCCYALQRPIAAVAQLPEVAPAEIRSVRVTTPAASLTPLIHSRPNTGLEGKFSLQYALAATFLDGPPGLAAFTDEAVQRPQARGLMELVEATATGGGEGLLEGDIRVELALHDGQTKMVALELPPGAPGRPPTEAEIAHKLIDCAGELAADIRGLDWPRAAAFLGAVLA
jgi:2-methylcitrate dehydratase PrpD